MEDIDKERVEYMRKLLQSLKEVKEYMECIGWTDSHCTSQETIKYYEDTIEMIESIPYEIKALEEG